MLRKECDKHWLIVFDCSKCKFKQRFEVVMPGSLEAVELKCLAIPLVNRDEEFIAVGGCTYNPRENVVSFPIVKVYRRTIDHRSYQDYSFCVLRSKNGRSVCKLEVLSRSQNGWSFLLAILEVGIMLVRFKDKKFQIVENNEQFRINSKFSYALSPKGEIITTDFNKKQFLITCNLSALIFLVFLK